jgi:Ca-activated chloride channel family protein
MFEFVWPWILLILPLPWLVWHFMPPAISLQQSSVLQVPFFNEIEQCLEKQKKTELKKSFWKNKSRIFALLVWIVLVLAASNPQWVGEPQYISQSGRDLMLAVDLSSSMSIPDMIIDHKQVERLDAIKAVASDFISHRTGDRIGLILFGSKAYLQTPLTYDLSTVKTMLNDASIGLAGNLTSIGDAIGLAIKRLSQSELGNRVLILLTDGSNNSGSVEPLEAARMAAQQHIRIYTIGVGSENSALQGLMGLQKLAAKDQLDITTLQSIANQTGGLFFRVTDIASLQFAYKQLDQIEPVKSGHIIYSTTIVLYPWFLSLALLLSIGMILTRHIKMTRFMRNAL